jgi:glycine oxidase
VEVDYLIIGQGIAGSTLAFLLEEKGKSFVIIDNGHLSSSSMIAAGLWNPVTFKRLIPSWNADILLPVMDKVYPRIEQSFGISIYHPMEMARLFPTASSTNEWDERSTRDDMRAFLSDKQIAGINSTFIAPFGHGVVNHTGWLDVPLMLDTMRNHWLVKGVLRSVEYEHNQLQTTEEGVCYQDISAQKVIFCIGSKNADITEFAEVPIDGNKGQVLTLRNTELKLENVVNFGNFLLPTGNGHFRLGATFEFFDPSTNTTEEGKQTLLSSLAEVLSIPMECIDHRAGHRPTVRDRRPVLGAAKANDKLLIFNGFGAKGVMIVPYCAELFIDALLTDSIDSLGREVSIKRFEKKR